MPHTMFIVYDGRAILEGTDEAAVLSTARSLREALRDARDFGYECAIYEYRVDPSTNELVNEQFVKVVSPQ